MALARAGRRLDDLDVAEIYGAFAASELMTYEAMGLFGPRRGAGRRRARRDRPRRPDPDQHLRRPAVARPPAAGDAPARDAGGLRAAHWRGRRAAGRRTRPSALVQAEHGVMNGSAVAVLEV